MHFEWGQILLGNQMNRFENKVAPEEVSGFVAFLAADEAGFITGQVYTVDGGRMIQLSLP